MFSHPLVRALAALIDGRYWSFAGSDVLAPMYRDGSRGREAWGEAMPPKALFHGGLFSWVV